MINRTTIQEISIINKLLDTLPKNVQSGTLPYKEWEETKNPLWVELRKRHNYGTVTAIVRKEYKKRILPIETKKTLNHAYNFCPNCGFKLN